MPFIDCKLSKKVTDKQKEEIKAKLGNKISIMHKTESYLMVGIQDGYDLWFAGNKLEDGAYVGIKVYGRLSSADCSRMTGAVCDILSETLGIDGQNIYVTYQGIADWGWDGSNF